MLTVTYITVLTCVAYGCSSTTGKFVTNFFTAPQPVNDAKQEASCINLEQT